MTSTHNRFRKRGSLPRAWFGRLAPKAFKLPRAKKTHQQRTKRGRRSGR